LFDWHGLNLIPQHLTRNIIMRPGARTRCFAHSSHYSLFFVMSGIQQDPGLWICTQQVLREALAKRRIWSTLWTMKVYILKLIMIVWTA